MKRFLSSLSAMFAVGFLLAGAASAQQVVPPSPGPGSQQPASSPSAVPVALLVANTSGEGVYIHGDPPGLLELRAWPEGTVMVPLGDETDIGGKLWRNVRDPDGSNGWVPVRYLALVPATTPANTPTSGPSEALPTEPQQPTSTPTASPFEMVVAGAPPERVILRTNSPTGSQIAAWPDDTTMLVLGPGVEVAGMQWVPARDPSGNEGWVPAHYLITPTPSPIPTETPQPTPTVAPTPTPPPATGRLGPAAKCSDGTYGYSTDRDLVCAGHGDVSQWLR